jgi:hypothetical protein
MAEIVVAFGHDPGQTDQGISSELSPSQAIDGAPSNPQALREGRRHFAS